MTKKKKTIMKPCCVECGFPVDIPREPVFIKNNLFALAEVKTGQCGTCGHQKSGWTIPVVYEHIRQLRESWVENDRTKDWPKD